MAFNRKARLQANIDAIRTAFAVWKEVRVPTETERETISRYCGFGGLKCVLNPVENKAVWPKNDLPLYDLTAELHRVAVESGLFKGLCCQLLTAIDETQVFGLT